MSNEGTAGGVGDDLPIICLSREPWDPPLGRPHRLMSRFAARRSVFFVEPPLTDKPRARLQARSTADAVAVLTPQLTNASGVDIEQKLIEGFVDRQGLGRYVLWYDTPLAVSFTHRLTPSMVVYDRTTPPAGTSTVDLQVADSALLMLADLIIVSGDEASLPTARGRVLAMPTALAATDSAPEAWDVFFRSLRDAFTQIARTADEGTRPQPQA